MRVGGELGFKKISRYIADVLFFLFFWKNNDELMNDSAKK